MSIQSSISPPSRIAIYSLIIGILSMRNLKFWAILSWPGLVFAGLSCVCTTPAHAFLFIVWSPPGAGAGNEERQRERQRERDGDGVRPSSCSRNISPVSLSSRCASDSAGRVRALCAAYHHGSLSVSHASAHARVRTKTNERPRLGRGDIDDELRGWE